MQIKGLFILTDFKKSVSSGMQQRVFIDSLSDDSFTPTVLCERGNINIMKKCGLESIRTIPTRFIQLVLITLFPKRAFAHDISNLKVLQYFGRAKQLLKDGDYSYIHTCSLPCISHYVGLKLKKEYGIPWIASFYDPWYGNPERTFFTNFFRRRDQKIEAEIAMNADVIIHSNLTMVDIWVERYGEDIRKKIEILPFGGLRDKFEKAKTKKKKVDLSNPNKIIISHVGSLSEIRPINTIIEALKVLFKNNPDLKKVIELRFVGPMSKNNKTIIDSSGLDYCIKRITRQPASELNKFYDQTDILLLMDADITPNIYFPSKLPDYLIQKLPIMAITSSDSATHQYLTEAGHYCFEYRDVKGVISYLEKVSSSYNTITTFDENYYKKFAPEVINQKYQEIINKYIKFE